MNGKANTTKKGAVRVIIFKDLKDNIWYGVALEFNIVISAKNYHEAHVELVEAMEGYVDALSSIRGLKDYSALNQNAIKEYDDLWNRLEQGEKIPSPYLVKFHGLNKLHA